MTAQTAAFDARERASLSAAAAISEELLLFSGRRDDLSAVQAAASCRPSAAVLARAGTVLAALRDRCAAESAADFWLDEMGAVPQVDVAAVAQSLTEARTAQAHVLGSAAKACRRVSVALAP